uniref:Peptidase M48 domain-containing protein n=1 Tax=Araucaria cunninghamii TaxID=56994 RepID=A0A0D6R2P1_ARACU
MAVSRCGKVKQVFKGVRESISGINRLCSTKTVYGPAVESSRGKDYSESGSFRSVFHCFRNLKPGCSSTLSNTGNHGFKRFSGKRGVNSGRTIISSFGVEGRTIINHGFGPCKTRNVAQGRRFYYVDRYHVQHFKARGPKRRIENPQKLVVIVTLGSGLVLTIYYSNLETVPYSHRKHCILISREMEKQLGESQFEELKKALKPKILPAIHPESVRVKLIAKDIIQALERGIRREQSWTDVDYGNTKTDASDISNSQDPWSVAGEKAYSSSQWYGKDEILDDKWVEKSRRSGQQSGEKVSTQHLDGLNWEIIVVDDRIVNAFCLPGGKIVVFTGLLNVFRTDAEIATVISHEVGHAVARHQAEGMTSNLWLAIVQFILFQLIGMADVVLAISNILLRLPFSRRMEMEADYIGLLLMASAGYDPRVAPSVYEKLGELSGDSVIQNYLSTHPSGRKRGEILRQAKVMEEAVGIYRDQISGHRSEGFL